MTTQWDDDVVQPVSTQDNTEISWRLIARGALVGISIIVPVTVLHAVLDHELNDFDDSGWRSVLYLFILAGFFAAGWVTGRVRWDTPFMHGTLAAEGSLLLWIPARVVIWAVREDDRGLLSGKDAALRPGQVFGAVLIAAALGMFGAWLGARVAERRSSV
jgi:hypothetical protein